MWLTAAETAQHKGAAGTGVILDGLNRARCGILIEDDYTRVDGLELKNFGHCFVPAAVAVRYAKGVVLERLIVHDFDVRHRESFGIKGGVHSDFIARNCIIYNGGTAGIVTRWKSFQGRRRKLHHFRHERKRGGREARPRFGREHHFHGQP